MTWSCATCGFEIFTHVRAPTLRVTELGLYDDARFPGRVLVCLREHHTDLEDLDSDTLANLWRDVTDVARAVKAVSGSGRVNYAVLGNAIPHVHVHVIPRFPDRESLPTRPPWNDPRPLLPLPDEELVKTRIALEHLLDSR